MAAFISLLAVSTLFHLSEGKLFCSELGMTVNCSPDTADESAVILKRHIVSDNNTTRSINLSNCRISDIDYESFHRLPRLRHLDLSNNIIIRLKLGVLDGFKDLTHLNLSGNFLTTFPLGLFDQKPNLIDLDLSNNKIEELTLGIFDPLQKLVNLDLSNNALEGSEINSYLFDQSQMIKQLKFSGNDMNNAQENLLHSVTRLQTLELDRCQLEGVPKFISKANLRDLQNLHLSGNVIGDINNETFANLPGLLTLNLSSNLIKNLDENSFKQLKNLKSINLRNNHIRELSETLFYNMVALANIDLSSNLISYVPVNAFRGTKLKNLNLSNNKFSYLQDNFCLELRNSGAILTKFYFNDNPWQCSCLRDILNEVKKYEIVYNSAKYDGTHPVCVVINHNACQRHREFTNIINESD